MPKPLPTWFQTTSGGTTRFDLAEDGTLYFRVDSPASHAGSPVAQESLRGQRARPGSEADASGPSGWSGGDKDISANDGRLGFSARFQKQVSGKIISKANSRKSSLKPTHLPERAGTQPPKSSRLMDQTGA